MDNTILDIINTVFSHVEFILSMLIVVMTAYCFLGRYIKLTRSLVLSSFGIVGVYILFLVVANLYFTEEINNYLLYVVDIFYNVFLFIYSFVFYLFAFKEKRFLRAVEATVCLYLFTMYLNSFTELAILYLVGGTDETFENIFVTGLGRGPYWSVIQIMSMILTIALFVLLYFGFYKARKQIVVSIPFRVLFVVWIVIFLIVPTIPIFVFSDEYGLETKFKVLSFLFGLSIIILGLIVPVVFFVSYAEKTMRAKNKYQESYLAAEIEYIESYKKKQTETRAFRHDIVNNLSLTSMLLKEGHVDEAKEHIDSMMGNVKALSPSYVTGDEMLDLIVTMKADKMEELGGAFSLDGVVDGGLNIKPMDMCSIFANALDNAIEAASKCASPSVTLNIKRTNKFFIIRIANSSNGKVNTDKLMSASGYTTKKDAEHHGFGLLNIRNAVERYNGIIKAESDDSTFALSIMIPRNEKKALS